MVFPSVRPPQPTSFSLSFSRARETPVKWMTGYFSGLPFPPLPRTPHSTCVFSFLCLSFSPNYLVCVYPRPLPGILSRAGLRSCHRPFDFTPPSVSGYARPVSLVVDAQEGLSSKDILGGLFDDLCGEAVTDSLAFVHVNSLEDWVLLLARNKAL